MSQSADQFVRRMENVLDDLHLAIEEADVDMQERAFAALVGLLEMLKSEIVHGDDNGDDAA